MTRITLFFFAVVEMQASEFLLRTILRRLMGNKRGTFVTTLCQSPFSLIQLRPLGYRPLIGLTVYIYYFLTGNVFFWANGCFQISPPAISTNSLSARPRSPFFSTSSVRTAICLFISSYSDIFLFKNLTVILPFSSMPRGVSI